MMPMWSKLKLPPCMSVPMLLPHTSDGVSPDPRWSGPSVEEEYTEVIRTSSFAEISEQVHRRRRAIPRDYTQLLEPKPEILAAIVDRARPHPLVLDYLAASLDACNLCGSLLDSIDRARHSRRIVHRILNLDESHECSDEQRRSMLSELASLSLLGNPLAGPNPAQQLRSMHEVYKPMVPRLRSAQRRAARRARLGLLGSCRAAAMARAGAQLDAAARGAFAVDRELDTVGPMLARLSGEIERAQEAVRLVLAEGREGVGLREVAKGLKERKVWFDEELEELEEHVYLCFLSINRVRRMVVEEIVDEH